MGGSRTNTVVTNKAFALGVFARGVRRAVVTTRETLALHPGNNSESRLIGLDSHAQSRPGLTRPVSRPGLDSHTPARCTRLAAS